MIHDGKEFSPARLYADLVEAGEAWAHAEAGASLLEESRKSALSQIKLRSTEKSDAARETEALASPEYQEHVEKMVEARRLANVARVKWIAIQTYTELLRTQQSNLRAGYQAEMQLAQNG